MTNAAQNLGIRPLVLGAEGLVGKALTLHLEERFPHTVSAGRAELDIRDRWRVEAELERLEPNVLINCAAIGDVDHCERDPDLARIVNTEGPAQLAAACANARIRMIHLSTDYVFGAQPPIEGEFDEAEFKAPVNEYGRSKAAGEDAVLGSLIDALVLRVSFVFGPGRKTFLDKIARGARASSAPLRVVDSWLNKATYTGDLCQAIERLLREDVTGVWHFASGPAVTRLGFAKLVFKLLGEDPERVQPLAVDELSLAAERPAATPLSTKRWEARFGAAPRSWIEGVREYLALGGASEGTCESS